MIDDDDDVGVETGELNYHLELIKGKWNQFLSLEAEIEKELMSLEKKNVSKMVDESSEIKAELTVNDFITVCLQRRHLRVLLLHLQMM